MPGFKISESGGSGPSNTIEVARKHRYKFTISDIDESVIIYAYKATRPTCEIDRITMHCGQDEIYLPGKQRWLPIEITFYDAYDGKAVVSEALYEWRAEVLLHVKESTQGKQSAYKKRAELSMLDGFGEPVWTYYMLDAWPSKITPSDVAYDDTGLADITMVLEMSKATEKGVSVNKSQTPNKC